MNDGAEVLCGGRVPKLDNKLDKGYFLEPTVLGGQLNFLTLFNLLSCKFVTETKIDSLLFLLLLSSCSANKRQKKDLANCFSSE